MQRAQTTFPSRGKLTTDIDTVLNILGWERISATGARLSFLSISSTPADGGGSGVVTALNETPQSLLSHADQPVAVS
jgi:hypothetical protein